MTSNRQTRLHNQVHRLSGHTCGGGVEVCSRMTELLDQIEEERAHAEAEKLRKYAEEYDDWGERPFTAGLFQAVEQVDPYEMRDGQLVHKSDGKPVII